MCLRRHYEEGGWGTSGHVLHGLELLWEGDDKDTDMLVFFFFFKLIESIFLLLNTKEDTLNDVQHWIPLTFIVQKTKEKQTQRHFKILSFVFHRRIFKSKSLKIHFYLKYHLFISIVISLNKKCNGKQHSDFNK